jgi:Fe-S-cluster containining protein
MTSSMKNQRCKKCGTCCQKGGPALHQQDEALLTEGLLLAQDLCTFRAGELVRDEGEGRLSPLPHEIVKIAPTIGLRPDDWTCRFLTSNNTCFLYGKHPAECRALFCQSPETLMAMSGQNRLNRYAIRGLLNSPPWWAELMETHEEACSYGTLSGLAPRLKDNADARRDFLRIVEYDRVFRELVLEKNAALPEELDFLFGRPLLKTVIMFGLDARLGADGRITLVQTTGMVYPKG